MLAGAGIRPGTFFWRGPDRFDYHRNRKVNGGRISLRCTQYYMHHCLGRASVRKDGKYFRSTRPHNHDPDRYHMEARSLRRAIMDRCRSGDATSFKRVYHEERRRLGIRRQAAARIPLVKLRTSMRRARLQNRPRIPKTLKELHKMLSKRRYRHLSRTMDGEDYVYAGKSGSSTEKTIALIFTTHRMLRRMRKVKRIFCDGTFSPVPKGLKAHQVWTICTIRRNHVVPLVRVLMRRRTKRSYTAVLTKLRDLAPRFEPTEVLADYEPAEQGALVDFYPNASCSGCLFHYSRAIGMKARQLGLKPCMDVSPEVRSIVRQLSVLPLLPTEYIKKGFRAVVKSADRKNLLWLLSELFLYWIHFWLGNLHILSVHDSENRTSNASESDNRVLQDAVGRPKPHIWDFMDGILEVEDTTEQDIATMDACRPASRARAVKTLINDTRVQSLNADLAAGFISIRKFLRLASVVSINSLNVGLGVRAT